MRRSADSEGSSSLEMLLDTMCNTFGGTIFLAIALIIIASMIQKDTSTPESKNAKTAEALSQEIAKLEVESQKLASEVSLKAEVIKLKKDDPRMERILELAELEDALKQLRQQVILTQMKREQADLATAAERAVLARMKEQLDRQETADKKLDQELGEIKSEIANVKKALSKSAQKMVFKKLQKAGAAEVPYFVIAKAGKLWRIGPDSGNPIVVNGDVTYVLNGNAYQCHPISSKGTAILSGDAVSQDALRLLDTLPAGRYPIFQIYPDCAAEYFKLAEALKSKSKPYAPSPRLPVEIAGFTLVENAEYER